MSVTTTPSGTRGARITRLHLLIARLFRGTLVRSHRKKGDTFQGKPVLYLSTLGAKTGKPRLTPVGYETDGEGAWLIVASLGGAARHPSWYHNLAAHPNDVSIEVGGRRYDVAVEQLEGERRAVAWEKITTSRPSMAEYQQQTDRILPVLRLTAR